HRRQPPRHLHEEYHADRTESQGPDQRKPKPRSRLRRRSDRANVQKPPNARHNTERDLKDLLHYPPRLGIKHYPRHVAWAGPRARPLSLPGWLGGTPTGRAQRPAHSNQAKG